jgi:hypothetical protein
MTRFWRQPRRGAADQMLSSRAWCRPRVTGTSAWLTWTGGWQVRGRRQLALVPVPVAERGRVRNRSVPVGGSACQWQWRCARG